MIKHALSGFVAMCVLAVTTPASSGGSCDAARASLAQAQSAYASATRAADKAAAKYHQCMQRTKNDAKACSGSHDEMRSAAASKRAARDALRFAEAKVKESCG